MRNHVVRLLINVRKFKQSKVERILYGLCKVHTALSDVYSPFRLILSAIGTPSYKLAKLLVLKLSSIAFNKFTVKDSFAFAEEIVHQDIKLFIGSLDVDSLFTNIPLKETRIFVPICYITT